MGTGRGRSTFIEKSVAVTPLEAVTAVQPEARFAFGTCEISPFTSVASARRIPWSLATAGVLAPEAVSLPVFVIGADGRIEDVNTLGEALVGYSRSELVGQAMEQIVSSSAGVCAHHRTIGNVAVEVVVFPHVLDSIIAIVRPTTESEPGVLRHEDVAQIVHDLRSPLGTIALETHLLEDGARDPDVRKTVARITRNVGYLERMVQTVLDLCSIDAGRLTIRRRPTELRSLLEDVVARVIATHDRSRVFIEAPHAVLLSIDELRIERVVANLLANALKHSARGSPIVVRLDAWQRSVCVSVIDAGLGMSAAEMKCVFDKYRRVSTSGAQEGSGLGLFVSRRIVEAHGGRLDVESLGGVGTRFFFELPTE